VLPNDYDLSIGAVKYALDQAKKETVDEVCKIVKKQLALAEGTDVCGSSKFQELGADSLDTVSELQHTFKFSTT
jgi:hypothetical protein